MPRTKKKNRFSAMYILLGIFLVLLALAFLPDLVATRKDDQEMIFFHEFQIENAVKIELKKAANPFTVLEKREGVWTVRSRDYYKADSDLVDALLTGVANLRGNSVVSKNPEKQADLGVDDENGFRVILFDASENVIANFLIGKRGPTYTSQYVRKDGSNDVYLVQENLDSSFDKEEWRDTTILTEDSVAPTE